MPHTPNHNLNPLIPQNPSDRPVQFVGGQLEEEQQPPPTFSAGGQDIGFAGSVEEATQLANQGVRPIFQPQGIDELDTVDLQPNEAQQEAIREAARAKIAAARNNLDAARSVEDQATRQLVGSVLGEQLFNALTGASVPTGQQQAEQQFQGAMRDVIQGARDVATTQTQAEAQEQAQLAQLEAQTEQREREINQRVREQNRELRQQQFDRIQSTVEGISGILESAEQRSAQQLRTLRDRLQGAKQTLFQIGRPETFREDVQALEKNLESLRQRKQKIAQGINPNTGARFVDPAEQRKALQSVQSDIQETRFDLSETQRDFQRSRFQLNQVEALQSRLDQELGVDTNQQVAPRETEGGQTDLDQRVTDMLSSRGIFAEEGDQAEQAVSAFQQFQREFAPQQGEEDTGESGRAFTAEELEEASIEDLINKAQGRTFEQTSEAVREQLAQGGVPQIEPASTEQEPFSTRTPSPEEKQEQERQEQLVQDIRNLRERVQEVEEAMINNPGDLGLLTLQRQLQQRINNKVSQLTF